MSDAYLPVRDASKEPEQDTPLIKGARFLLDHYWKLFALVVLAGTFYLAQEALSDWNGFRAMSMTVTNNHEHPEGNYLRSMTAKQSGPGAVVLKGSSATARGYLADANEDFVVLGTLYKDESRQETVVIPWDNILYVQLNLKEEVINK